MGTGSTSFYESHLYGKNKTPKLPVRKDYVHNKTVSVQLIIEHVDIQYNATFILYSVIKAKGSNLT